MFFLKRATLFLLIKLTSLLLLIIILGGGGFLLWQHYYPVVAHDGWSYKVLYNNITKASALYKDPQGNLIVAEELNNSQGRILRIAPDGVRTALFSDLNKPDGITFFNGGIVFSQEGGKYPVQWFNAQGAQTLFMGTNVQGLVPNKQYLYAVEDTGKNSKILRFNSLTQTLTEIRTGLNEAETLAICPDGKKYYNEKKIHLIRQLTDDKTDPIVLDYKNTREPSILKCDDNGLWISEDSTHMARLLLLKPNGQLTVILSHLRAPQQLLRIGENKYLLAKGGRDRVIEIKKKSEPANH